MRNGSKATKIFQQKFNSGKYYNTATKCSTMLSVGHGKIFTQSNQSKRLNIFTCNPVPCTDIYQVCWINQRVTSLKEGG